MVIQHIHLRRQDDALLLPGVNKFPRGSDRVAVSRLDFNENDILPVFGDNIYLPEAAGIVFLDDPVALPFEIPRRSFFAFFGIIISIFLSE